LHPQVVYLVHYYAGAVLEVHRIDPLLALGKTVVAERSSDGALDSVYEQKAKVRFYTGEEELVQQVEAVLAKWGEGERDWRKTKLEEKKQMKAQKAKKAMKAKTTKEERGSSARGAEGRGRGRGAVAKGGVGEEEGAGEEEEGAEEEAEEEEEEEAGRGEWSPPPAPGSSFVCEARRDVTPICHALRALDEQVAAVKRERVARGLEQGSRLQKLQKLQLPQLPHPEWYPVPLLLLAIWLGAVLPGCAAGGCGKRGGGGGVGLPARTGSDFDLKRMDTVTGGGGRGRGGGCCGRGSRLGSVLFRLFLVIVALQIMFMYFSGWLDASLSTKTT
jgi:hypothetical protein